MGEEASPGTMMGLHGPPGQGMWVPDEIPAELPSHSSEGEEEEEPTSEGGEPLYSSSSEAGATERVLARRERAATRRRAHRAGEAFEGWLESSITRKGKEHVAAALCRPPPRVRALPAPLPV